MINFIDEKGIKHSAIVECKKTKGVNGEKSLSGTIYTNDEILEGIGRGWRLEFENEKYCLTYVYPIDEGNRIVVEFDAVHEFFFDLNKKVVYTELNGSNTAKAYLDLIFNGSGYSYLIEVNIPAFEKESFGMRNRLDLFKEFISSTGVEFSVSGKVVRILEKVGSNLSTIVKKGFNLNELRIEKDPGSFITYKKGFGAWVDDDDHSKGRLEVEYLSPLASIYGKLEGDPIVDERYKVASNFETRLKNDVEASYGISVDIDMEDLTRAGYEYEQPHEGDYIMAINKDLGFEQKIRIMSYETSYDTNGNIIDHKVACGSDNIIRKSIKEDDEFRKEIQAGLEGAISTSNKAWVSANGKNAVFKGPDEPTATAIGDIWWQIDGEEKKMRIWNGYEWKIEFEPTLIERAIDAVDNIATEASKEAQKNTKQINDALESGEVLSLKDLFARKIGTDEFNTLFYQETNAIGLTYMVDGVMEAIIAIQDGFPLIKGKHIVLDGNTIVDGDFTVTGDMLADSAVIDKLKAQGINAAEINVTNLNASSFTSGDIDALNIRIMAGDVPIMSVNNEGEVIFNVSQMKIGNIEAATKDDVTNATANKVTSTNVEYYLSNSTTSLSGGSWQTTAPLWVDGKYMWQRTKVVLGDGTIKYTPNEGGTCVSGGVGPSGDDGISVTSIQEYYAVSTSNTTAPTTWQTTVQQMTVTNKYLWNYEEFSLSDESKISTKKRVIGVYGDKGPQGDEGKGIKSNAVTYQIGDSGTTAPVGTWNAAIPTPVKGKYLWTRTITTYTDNTNSTIYSVSYLPTDGQNGGTGVGVQSTEVTYQLHTNGTTAPTGAWTTTIPTPIKGRYLWTKTVITYTNSTTSTAYSTSYYPLDGQTGNPGIDGNSISSVTNYYLASASATGVTTATAGWTMTVQVPTTAKKYLWNYEVIKYSKIADTITTPTIIGVYGETGSTGKGVTSITAEYALSESKTTAPTTWSVTAPIWESGKYIWTRSKIIYSNPTSTAYTTPIVDSSWEAVNELEESTQEKLDEKANSNDLNEGLGNVWEELEDKAEKGELSEIELLARKLQESYEAYVDPENGIAKENLDALYDRMNGFILELQDKIATFDFIHTTIKLGEEGLSIGSSESSLKMLLTNNRLSFMDGGQEVAYFSGQSFYINRGAVVQSLQIGQHKITNLGNGHTVIQWVGG